MEGLFRKLPEPMLNRLDGRGQRTVPITTEVRPDPEAANHEPHQHRVFIVADSEGKTNEWVRTIHRCKLWDPVDASGSARSLHSIGTCVPAVSSKLRNGSKDFVHNRLRFPPNNEAGNAHHPLASQPRSPRRSLGWVRRREGATCSARPTDRGRKPGNCMSRTRFNNFPFSPVSSP
jgi:hypothetical protein